MMLPRLFLSVKKMGDETKTSVHWPKVLPRHPVPLKDTSCISYVTGMNCRPSLDKLKALTNCSAFLI